MITKQRTTALEGFAKMEKLSTLDEVREARNSVTELDRHGRRVPQDFSAEQAFIGGILKQTDIFNLVGDFLCPHHLFDPLHAGIYACIGNSLRRHGRASIEALSPFFRGVNAATGIVAIEYLLQLEKAGPSPPTVLSCAHVIYDLARRRALISIGKQLADDAFDMSADNSPSDLIEWAGMSLSELL